MDKIKLKLNKQKTYVKNDNWFNFLTIIVGIFIILSTISNYISSSCEQEKINILFDQISKVEGSIWLKEKVNFQYVNSYGVLTLKNFQNISPISSQKIIQEHPTISIYMKDTYPLFHWSPEIEKEDYEWTRDWNEFMANSTKKLMVRNYVVELLIHSNIFLILWQ